MSEPAPELGSFRSIIDLWPTKEAAADDIGADAGKVSKWWQRDSIPSPHWFAWVEAAGRRGFSGVTFELLARLAAEKAPGAAPAEECAR